MTTSSHRSPQHPTRRVSTAEAKARLSELVGAVAFRGDRVVIERRGRPVAALVSVQDAERLAEAATAGSARRRGALALVGSWSDVHDAVIDRVVASIYEARSRDTGRAIELEG